jgi:hypothetical protein
MSAARPMDYPKTRSTMPTTKRVFTTHRIATIVPVDNADDNPKRLP